MLLKHSTAVFKFLSRQRPLASNIGPVKPNTNHVSHEVSGSEDNEKRGCGCLIYGNSDLCSLSSVIFNNVSGLQWKRSLKWDSVKFAEKVPAIRAHHVVPRRHHAAIIHLLWRRSACTTTWIPLRSSIWLKLPKNAGREEANQWTSSGRSIARQQMAPLTLPSKLNWMLEASKTCQLRLYVQRNFKAFSMGWFSLRPSLRPSCIDSIFF